MWHYKRDTAFHARPKEQQVAVAVEPVLERELWQAAQTRLSDGRQSSQRKCYREYMMRTRIRCECGYARGGATGGSKRQYYECLSRRDTHRGCTYRFHRADHADRVIWQWITTVVLDPDNLREGLEAQRESAQSERRKLDDMRERYQLQCQKVDAETHKLIQLYTSGLFTLEQITAEKSRLDNAKRAITNEMQAIDQQIAAFGLTDDEVLELTAFAQLIADRVHNADYANRVRVVELLDVRATCATVLDEHDKRVDLVHVTCMLTTDKATLPIERGKEADGSSRTESIARSNNKHSPTIRFCATLRIEA